MKMKNMKRKDVDQVSEDFSDFSLSSPPTKIRRLDAELPPIVEEEEEPSPFPLPEVELEEGEAATAAANNQERALVLFKPPLPHSPSPFSLTLHSDFIPGIKNRHPWSKLSDSDGDRITSSVAEAEEEQQDYYSNNNTTHGLAIVPWVPSSSQGPPATSHDLMEAEEMGGGGEEEEASLSSSMMDVEQDTTTTTTTTTGNSSLTNYSTTLHEGFQQWQQQHCLLPQFPQNTSTPITWTR